jgi:hypothetical protein
LVVSLTVMAKTPSAAVPVFVSVTVCARLGWPTGVVKAREISERASCAEGGGGCWVVGALCLQPVVSVKRNARAT